MPTPGFDGERHARRLAPPGVLLLAAGIFLGDWFGLLLVVVGAGLLVLAAISPDHGVLLVGPFARAELVAFARRKPIWRWRAIYVAAVAVALYLVVFRPGGNLYGKRVSPSVYTQNFFLGVSAGLLMHLLHTTLAVVAPIAAEEREKKRWEMLLTTDLRNREVLFGKLAGRLPGLLEPLLAVLPVLAVLPLLGGVPPVLVAAVGVAGLALLFGWAGLAAVASVTMPTAEKAVNAARGYAWGYVALSGGLIAAAVYPPLWTFPTSLGWTSPVEVRHVVQSANAGNPFGAPVLTFGLGVGRSGSVEDDLLTLARRCLGFWVLVGGLAWLAALTLLRGVRLGGSPVAGRVKVRLKPVPARPPVTDAPVMWWAEYGHLSAYAMRQVAKVGRWRYLRWFVVSLAGLGFCRWWAFAYPDAWPHLGTVADAVSPLFLVIWAAVVLFIPPFHAATLIAKERAGDTLPALLLTDLTARDVVFQKWAAAVWMTRHAWVGGLCWGAAAVLTRGVPWWAVPLAVAVPAYLAPCWAAFGIAFSAHAGTPAKAQRNLSGWLFGGGYVLAALLGGLVSLVPGMGNREVAGWVVAGLVVLAQPVAGWFAFRYAVRRLEREHG